MIVHRTRSGQLGYALPGAVAAGAPGGPVGIAISAGVAAVSLVLGLLFARKGPKQKVATTNIVNQLEPALQQNLAAYKAGPRTIVDQQAALANFDSAWAYLVSSQGCGSPDMGEPGQRCIKDRDRGGQWDWFAYYRDPIAQDETVKSTAAALVSSVTGSGSGILLLAAAACLVVGVLL